MSGTPHDALFKAIFSRPEQASAELASVLPAALAAEIDWSTLEPTPTAFTDPSLSQTESDLSFRVKCRGVLLHVILLFEHQSSDDPEMAFRLLRYMVRIWEGESVPLPPIVPVVLHHSEAGWRSATTSHDLVALGPLAGTGIEALVPSFRFVLDDVSRQSDEAVAARVEDALVRLALSVLRDARAATDGAALVRRLGGLLKDVHRSEGLRAAYGKILR